MPISYPFHGLIRVSDTQSHQIAARKEKQMETLRAALGIRMSEPSEQNVEMSDDGPQNGGKTGPTDDSKWGEKREHAFLDRDFSRKKSTAENQNADKNDKKKNKKKERDGLDDLMKHYKKGESDDRTDSDTDSDPRNGKKKKSSKKHVKSRIRDSDSESDDSASDDDTDSNSGGEEEE